MTDKRTHILESAMKLFADKGFHHTTIQEIADDSGVSKGSVYLHFRSKDDLILSILEHHFGELHYRMEELSRTDGPPRDKFLRQLQAHLDFLRTRKPFFVMLMREQGMGINEGLKRILHEVHAKTHAWIGAGLEEIYGADLSPYRAEVTLMFEGMLHALMRALLLRETEREADRVPAYLLDRLDEIAEGLVRKEPEPLIDEETRQALFRRACPAAVSWEDVRELLQRMEEVIRETKPENHGEYLRTVDYLLSQLDQGNPEPLVFQGMLANLKGMKELDPLRRKAADVIGIRLL